MTNPSMQLNDLYFYQNRKTGQASSTAVSVRQLCKILATQTTHVTSDTLVWSSEKQDEKWIPLRQLGILKEASAEWYYTTTGCSTSAGPVGVKGLQQKQEELAMVYSAQLADKGWFQAQDHSDLMLAMQAFEARPPNPVEEALQEEAKSQEEAGSAGEANEDGKDEVQKELEAFLRSTDSPGDNQQEKEEEGYQSDGGTNYVKDPMSDKWIHEALAPKQPQASPSSSSNGNKRPAPTTTTTQKSQAPTLNNPNKKKRKRSKKFTARNAKNWIYVTGLPLDTDEDEVAHVFLKAGILDLDSDSQKPKVKLYSTAAEDGERILKGDASICFARPESVDLALQLFHEAPFRLEDPIRSIIQVEHAKFEQRGEAYQKKALSWQKRQVAKKAALQAVGWDDADNGRLTGGIKGLTIVVLKHMFTIAQAKNDDFLEDLEKGIRTECSELGTVEKITVFTSNPEGVLVVRFKEPNAATSTVQKFNGRILEGDTKIVAHFWDGVTDYTVKDLDKEQKQAEERHEQFGEWLEEQDLPEELRLKVES